MPSFEVSTPEGKFRVDGVETPEEAYAAISGHASQPNTETIPEAPVYEEPAYEEPEPERSTMDEMGMGVDLAQQDAYNIAKAVGDATGLDGVSNWAQEGIAQQDADLAENNYVEGEDLGMASDFVRNAGQLLGGIGAGGLAVAGGLPALAGAGALTAGIGAMNVGKALNEADEEDTAGDIAIDAAMNTVLEVLPIPGLKYGAKAAKTIAKPAAKGLLKGVDKATDLSPGLKAGKKVTKEAFTDLKDKSEYIRVIGEEFSVSPKRQKELIKKLQGADGNIKFSQGTGALDIDEAAKKEIKKATNDPDEQLFLKEILYSTSDEAGQIAPATKGGIFLGALNEGAKAAGKAGLASAAQKPLNAAAKVGLGALTGGLVF